MFVKLKIDEGVEMPKYETENSAGLDLRAHKFEPSLSEGCALLEGEVVQINPRGRAFIGTGLSVEIPNGYEMQIRPRSGLALKNGITVLNSPGTIDSDYRGKIGIILVNTSSKSFFLEKGDRIAQAVFAKVEQAEFVVIDEMSDTQRGTGGFGSTGVK